MPRHVDSIKCGSCKGRHETIARVALCYREKHEAAAAEEEGHLQQQAEAAAELRNERWFEERGGAEDDPRERELWLLEDMRADAIIQARKDATLALLDRWKAANPGRQLNGYACTPYSRCNCPKSYSMCSAFAVLERFQAANPAPVAPHFHPGEFDECRVDHRADVKAAYEPRGFSLGGTRRRQPW